MFTKQIRFQLNVFFLNMMFWREEVHTWSKGFSWSRPPCWNYTHTHTHTQRERLYRPADTHIPLIVMVIWS